MPNEGALDQEDPKDAGREAADNEDAMVGCNSNFRGNNQLDGLSFAPALAHQLNAKEIYFFSVSPKCARRPLLFEA